MRNTKEIIMSEQHRFNDNDFAHHYGSRYGHTGRSYSYYQPAYRYGSELAADNRTQNRSWQELESEVRHRWQQRYADRDWSEMRDAIREGFDRGRSRQPNIPVETASHAGSIGGHVMGAEYIGGTDEVSPMDTE